MKNLKKVTATFNAEGTQVTITVEGQKGKTFNGKAEASWYVFQFDENKITDESSTSIVINQILHAPNLQDFSGNETREVRDTFSLFQNVIRSPFRDMFMLSVLFDVIDVSATRNADNRKEIALNKMVENPVFEICPNCQRHGNFVDASTGEQVSNEFWNKQDAMKWIEENTAKGFLQPQKADLLKTQVNGAGAKKIAQTEKEFLKILPSLL